MNKFEELLTKYLKENTYLKEHKIVKVDSVKSRDGWNVAVEYFPSWDSSSKYPEDNVFNVDFEDILVFLWENQV